MTRGTPSVTLFGHWICPYSVRVSYALAERRIAHDVVEVPPSAVRPPGYVVPEEFVEHSPRGEIPMVRIDGDHLADSLPVLEWLEERVEGRPLLPADPELRQRVRGCMAWIDATVFPPMVGVYYGTRPDRIAAASTALWRSIDALGDKLGDADWLVGDAPTLAEATVVPLYVRLDGLARLGFCGPVDPRVAAHARRLAATDGGRAVAWTPARTDEFVGRVERARAGAGAVGG